MRRRITEVPLGQKCTIAKVTGDHCLRLFDLGFYAGSAVTPLYECSGGGTRVYLVKDTLIALRQGDGSLIFVEEDVTWERV